MATKPNSNQPVRVERSTHPFPDRPSAQKNLRTSTFLDDEIILTLANAYENQRAQQVGEWERVQALRLKRAA